MKNAETPVVKIVLFGAISSLGSALMAEMLRRQHEVIAILDDLNALAPRPGLRTKVGSLLDADAVCESIAGSSVVICLLDASPEPSEPSDVVRLLLTSMQRMGIKRLILIDDFTTLNDASPLSAVLQQTPINWTLINAPQGVAGLTIEHFSQISTSLEPGLAPPLERLARVAAGIADELTLNLHKREVVNFVV
ncbi:NAD(P)-dependent oxidoreductase [Pseudomonas syringae]|uniref:NADH-flavin reductase n=1 Tax=Pseudomonas syringae TaxID=317 RepID=A0A085VIR2_PSESX|nr:NAD(P)H-binding protein [Pseudomonas syringae]KFE55325.1 NADH-flavin reductase [Pseudomonas syringae]